MKKIILFILALILTTVYIITAKSSLMVKLMPGKNISTSLLGSDRYYWGDLYGMSYLKEYKIRQESYYPDSVNFKGKGNTNLYMICDSYVWAFIKDGSSFANVNKMEYKRWLYPGNISEKLDEKKSNILIIELSERNIRLFLKNNKELYDKVYLYKDGLPEVNPFKLTLKDRLLEFSFKPLGNQNVDNNLFDFRFLTPVKELKATLNYSLFERTDVDVDVSTDKQYLFYSITVEPDLITSSFHPYSEKELSDIIEILNNAYSYYKSQGADEVYLSIIPNPVSILEPGRGNYNNIIERIENFPGRKIKTINITQRFKKYNGQIYNKSDSHWTYRGFYIWVDEVNSHLKNINRK